MCQWQTLINFGPRKADTRARALRRLPVDTARTRLSCTRPIGTPSPDEIPDPSFPIRRLRRRAPAPSRKKGAFSFFVFSFFAFSFTFGSAACEGRGPANQEVMCVRPKSAENPGFWRLLKTLATGDTILTHRPQAESRFLDLGG